MQTPTRFSIGNDNLIAIDGEGGAQVMQSLEGIALTSGNTLSSSHSAISTVAQSWISGNEK